MSFNSPTTAFFKLGQFPTVCFYVLMNPLNLKDDMRFADTHHKQSKSKDNTD